MSRLGAPLSNSPMRVVIGNYVAGRAPLQHDGRVGTLDDVVFNQAGRGLPSHLQVGVVDSRTVQKRIGKIAVANLVAKAPIHFNVIAIRVIRLHALDPAVRAHLHAEVGAVAAVVGIYLQDPQRPHSLPPFQRAPRWARACRRCTSAGAMLTELSWTAVTVTICPRARLPLFVQPSHQLQFPPLPAVET